MQDGDATGPSEPIEPRVNAPAVPSPTDSSSRGERVWVHRPESDAFAPCDLTDVVEAWDRLEELPGAEVIKSNLSRQVISLPETNLRPSLIVKRYRVRGRSERLKYRVLPSRAAREWRALEELESAGFPTPRPLAMFEERAGRWLVGAGLVMERLEEVFPAPDLVFADPSGEPARDELLRSCGRIVARLHHQGIAHPDLHLGNFLGNPDDSSDVRLVDLHAVHHRTIVGSPRRRTDLAKLIHSLGSDIDRHSVRQVIEAYQEVSREKERGTFLGVLEEEIDLILAEAHALERIRLASRDRRCWGTTSQFIAEVKGAFRIHRRREFTAESLAPLLERSWQALRTLDERSGERTIEVELPTETGTRVFILCEQERKLLPGLLDRFRRGPLERAWGTARRFEVRGLPHATAHALLIERKGGRTVRTLLVTEMVPGKTLADSVIERGTDPSELERFLRRTVDTVAPLLRNLHRAGIHTLDTRPENWRVEEAEPLGSSIVLRSLAPRSVTSGSSLARRRRNLVDLALLPGGRATLPLRLRFLLRYHAGERIHRAWLRDLDAEFGARQVEEIEARIARERAGESGEREAADTAAEPVATARREESSPPITPSRATHGHGQKRMRSNSGEGQLAAQSKDGDDRSTAE